MAKQESIINLPTLDDFTETSLLKQEEVSKITTSTESSKEDSEKSLKTTENEIPVSKATKPDKKQSSTAKSSTSKSGDKSVQDKVADKNSRAADPEPIEISDVDYKALTLKADDDLDSLTDEERDILIQKGYLEEEGATASFWDDVSKIHGLELEVDFGDVDPESPEGAALRDQVLVNKTVEDYLEYLKTNFPKAYKFLEHESNGGDINELFNVSKTDYSKIELKPENAEQQRKILVDYYKAKGFDEKRATRMMEADEDSEEGLFAAAKIALAEQLTAQQEQEAKVLETAKAQQAEIEARNNQFRGVVKQIAESGQVGNFNLDKKDKDEFYRFAMSNIYSNGKDGYQVVLPINQESLVPVLQQLLFAYKDGDLSAFVKREAQTQNVRKLKRKLQQESNKSSGQDDNTQSTVKKLPTFDVFTVNN